jgi:predicted transcriptional regulator
MTGMVTVYQRLASTMVVLFGKYGDVIRQAAARGQSRQSLYRETNQVVEAVAGEKSQARIAEAEQELAEVKARLQDLEERQRRLVEITADMQAEYASKAEALGVSLAAARELLTVFLKEQTPSVATLGRQTQAAAQKAREVLKVMDELVRPKVEQAAADEIFLGSKRL